MREQRLELKTDEVYQPGELRQGPADPLEIAQLLPKAQKTSIFQVGK